MMFPVFSPKTFGVTKKPHSTCAFMSPSPVRENFPPQTTSAIFTVEECCLCIWGL